MSAQHTPGLKYHLERRPGSRSVCRYSARPFSVLMTASVNVFANVPVEDRCTECHAKYLKACAAIAKATGSAALHSRDDQTHE